MTRTVWLGLRERSLQHARNLKRLSSFLDSSLPSNTGYVLLAVICIWDGTGQSGALSVSVINWNVAVQSFWVVRHVRSPLEWSCSHRHSLQYAGWRCPHLSSARWCYHPCSPGCCGRHVKSDKHNTDIHSTECETSKHSKTESHMSQDPTHPFLLFL